MVTISISYEEFADSPFTKSECEPLQYVSMKRYFRTVHLFFRFSPNHYTYSHQYLISPKDSLLVHTHLVIKSFWNRRALLLAETHPGESFKVGSFYQPVAIHFRHLELEAVKVSNLARLLHPAFGIAIEFFQFG